MRHLAYKKVLFISCLLNVFLFGVAITPMILGPPPPRSTPNIHDVLHKFERAKHRLSKEGQLVIDAVLEDKGRKMRDKFEQLRLSMRDAEQVLAARDFSDEKLHEAHEKLNTADYTLKESISDTIFEIATKLSAEDRIVFFKNALRKRH